MGLPECMHAAAAHAGMLADQTEATHERAGRENEAELGSPASPGPSPAPLGDAASPNDFPAATAAAERPASPPPEPRRAPAPPVPPTSAAAAAALEDDDGSVDEPGPLSGLGPEAAVGGSARASPPSSVPAAPSASSLGSAVRCTKLLRAVLAVLLAWAVFSGSLSPGLLPLPLLLAFNALQVRGAQGTHAALPAAEEGCAANSRTAALLPCLSLQMVISLITWALLARTPLGAWVSSPACS